jgi:hypothetical protein
MNRAMNRALLFVYQDQRLAAPGHSVRQDVNRTRLRHDGGEELHPLALRKTVGSSRHANDYSAGGKIFILTAKI